MVQFHGTIPLHNFLSQADKNIGNAFAYAKQHMITLIAGSMPFPREYGQSGEDRHMATETRPIDVDSFLDGLKFNRFHVLVLILCTILTAIDGYELYVVGWVLPDLAKDFGVDRTAIT